MLALVGCGRAKSTTQQRLKVMSMYELLTPDPQKVYNSSDYKIIQSVFEGLVVPDPETMEPLPGVAERWTVSPDGKLYEFYIRDNARWSDGSPVTAENFVFAVQRALSSRFACSNPELFFFVRNAREFFYRKIRDFSKVGITAINSRTLRIELAQCTPYFLNVLMHPCWSPLTQPIVESFEQFNKSFDAKNVIKLQIVSNGPFTFRERIPGDRLLMQKNINYWDVENVLLDSVLFKCSSDQSTIIKAFSEREVDVAEVPLDSALAVGDYLKNGELIPSATFECFALAINVDKPGLSDKRVRKALAFAINREKMLQNIEKNEMFAAHSFIPSFGAYSRDDKLFLCNAQEARKLLAEAGYPNGSQLPEIKILFNESESKANATALENVAQDWRTQLGVKVSFEGKDFDSFHLYRKNREFSATKVSFRAMYCDPALMLSVFSTNGSKNYGKWSDPNFDRMLAEIFATPDPLKRLTLVKSAEKYLVDNMPAIPLFFESKSYLVSNRVAGWYANIMNLHPLKFVYFAK